VRTSATANRTDRHRDRLVRLALLSALREGLPLRSGGTTNAGRLVRLVLEEAGAFIPSGAGDRAFRALVAKHLREAREIQAKDSRFRPRPS